MLIKIMLVFLLVMVALAFAAGPPFRRFLRNLLGLGRDGR